MTDTRVTVGTGTFRVELRTKDNTVICTFVTLTRLGLVVVEATRAGSNHDNRQIKWYRYQSIVNQTFKVSKYRVPRLPNSYGSLI